MTSSSQFTVPNLRTPILTTGKDSAPAGTTPSHVSATKSSQAHRLACVRKLVELSRMVRCNAGPTQREGEPRVDLSSGACRGCDIMAADLFHEPTPGFLLGFTGGLFHRNPQIFDLALDFFPRQEIEPAHQNRRLDDRGFGAIEAL